MPKTVDEAVDDWLGFNDLPKSKERVKSGGKLDVKEAVAFMEKGAMSEAQLVPRSLRSTWTQRHWSGCAWRGASGSYA